MSQLSNGNLETQLEFQISPTYSKPPSRSGEKRNVKKPASNCHLLVNIPQLAETDSLDTLFIVDYSPRSNSDSAVGI